MQTPTHRSRRDRAEVERLRTERRDSLLVLLARADRGTLTRPEAALLRAHVEAEIAAGDRARRSAGGQQTAVRRVQRRLDAAEAAIIEAEQRAEKAEATLARHEAHTAQAA
ncbi:hypothetical protein Q3V23_19045 [Streptomyces sp. VNUA116]|uniref:hypothetical protein n=1 Tax=Streptomyces sp. VNUA116 TaxID=3062449 RepID=UPI0026770A08|nr:hypothetical protein [Streptomyces sp. VNUA116]WKU45987.1 hypothetical protein Q3V23_19045 [Streptomyces sp. VNUA116]